MILIKVNVTSETRWPWYCPEVMLQEGRMHFLCSILVRNAQSEYHF